MAHQKTRDVNSMIKTLSLTYHPIPSKSGLLTAKQPSYRYLRTYTTQYEHTDCFFLVFPGFLFLEKSSVWWS